MFTDEMKGRHGPGPIGEVSFVVQRTSQSFAAAADSICARELPVALRERNSVVAVPWHQLDNVVIREIVVINAVSEFFFKVSKGEGLGGGGRGANQEAISKRRRPSRD